MCLFLALLTALIGVAFAAISCSTPQPSTDPKTGKVSASLTSYEILMESLHPIAWYRMDDTGTTAVDRSGNGHTGTYHLGTAYQDDAGMFGKPGAINDNNASVHFGTATRNCAPTYEAGTVYAGPYMEVPDHDDFSLTKGEDSFERDIADGLNDWGWPWGNINTAQVFGVQHTLSNWGRPFADTDASVLTGTFGQVYDVTPRLDSDVQIEVQWNQATTGSGAFYPLILTSRYSDPNNYYGARLSEASTGGVKIGIVKKVGGTLTALGTPVVVTTSYDHSSNMRIAVRLQTVTNGTGVDLKAKAWVVTSSTVSNVWPPKWVSNTDFEQQQPVSWTVSQNIASGTLSAGKTAVLTSNSSSSSPVNHSYVTFTKFRLQSVGMTVSGWYKTIDPDTFLRAGAGYMCSGGTTKEDYAHWLAKQYNGTEMEWLIRHYPGTAYDDACNPKDRRWASSAYSFSFLGGPGDAATNTDFNGRGAGSRFNPDASAYSVGGWHFVVGIYDPGDQTDTTAGVNVCVDAVCKSDITNWGDGGGGANYASGYKVNMRNGVAPLRIGASQSTSSWNQFQGEIDEVAIFDYKLTPAQVAQIYAERKP